jgi:hypothetical protein
MDPGRKASDPPTTGRLCGPSSFSPAGRPRNRGITRGDLPRVHETLPKKEASPDAKNGRIAVFGLKGGGVGKTCKPMGTVAGIKVVKITFYDADGDLVESGYFVDGEKYRTLKEARTAARTISKPR